MEEFLRCLSSVQGMARTVTRDVDLDGQTLRAGDRVLLVFGAGTATRRSSQTGTGW